MGWASSERMAFRKGVSIMWNLVLKQALPIVGSFLKTKQKQASEWSARIVDNSIKDELITIVILAPAVLVFFPPFVEPVKMGFEILATQMPEWYRELLLFICYAAFGVNIGAKGITKLKGKK